MDAIKKYEQALTKKELLENERSQLTLELKSISDLLNEETKDYLKIAHQAEKNRINERLKEISSEYNQLISYLNNNKMIHGEEIRHYLKDIVLEIKDYLDNPDRRSIEILKEKINNIEDYIKEIQSHIDILENNQAKTLTNTNDEDQIIKIPLDILMGISESNTDKNTKDFVILPKDLEFSNYHPNKKDGFSIQDFILDQSNHIKTVLEYFNNDTEKTLDYFQKKHGLANGEKINHTTFKNKMVELLGLSLKKKFELILDNTSITGSDNLETFYNFLQKISITDLCSKYSQIISPSTLNISETPFSSLPEYVNLDTVKQISDKEGRKFYCYVRLPDARKIEYINKIATKLKLNIKIKE